MVLESLEFELPLVSTIFLLFLLTIYLFKEKVQLPENRMFTVILLSSFFEALLDTIVHVICAFHPFEVITTEYYGLINYINKFLAILFVIIFASYLSYILMISFKKVSDNYKKVVTFTAIFYFVIFIFMQFTSVKILEVNNVTNVTGLTPSIAYCIVGICLIASLFVSFPKLKTRDKRYYSAIVITFFLGISMFITLWVPGMILYDVALVLMCYSMYFTIENPDVKMIQQLEVAREQADKANRAKTDFLSSMSHEIRTPLNAIVGFSDCIMEAESLGEAKENAKDIVNASQTLLEIVNGILDISKIEAGKIEIVNSIYNAPEIFEELATLITPKMNEKGLDFTYRIAEDLPKTLYGDHANIKKVVTNLLSNACKYTEKGFVHYEVNCINTKNVAKLIISVEDSGRGIKKESIDKMFTKFQRLDEDRNTTIEGTGLGLAITKQLIELMGGKIIVHTVYGEGSKFTVVLNQKIETGEVAEKKKMQTTLDLHDVRILLVDDTPLNLKVACKLLEKYNANQIVTCDSGFACIEKIKRGEIYDVILLDDMMPRMSGVETLKILKDIPSFHVPTVALTANAITGMREKYLADGFDDYLAKPIEKEQLIQVMNQILGRSLTAEIPVTPSVPKTQDETIRHEEVLSVEDHEKAEKERKKNEIIPVEDNIEELLKNQTKKNYQPEEVLEVLEEEPVTDVSQIDLVPVLDINVPTPTIAENTFDQSFLESHGVDVNHALELLGDMEMYNLTISDFMKEVESKWNRIVEYKNANNMPDYAVEVHSLKSDCKYLGFMSLADISYQHELKSKENDSNFVNEHFPELEEEYHKVLEIAKEYVEHNPVVDN